MTPAPREGKWGHRFGAWGFLSESGGPPRECSQGWAKRRRVFVANVRAWLWVVADEFVPRPEKLSHQCWVMKAGSSCPENRRHVRSPQGLQQGMQSSGRTDVRGKEGQGQTRESCIQTSAPVTCAQPVSRVPETQEHPPSSFPLITEGIRFHKHISALPKALWLPACVVLGGTDSLRVYPQCKLPSGRCHHCP